MIDVDDSSVRLIGLTAESVAGLILYRDRYQRLHAGKTGVLPEQYEIGVNTVALLRLKASRDVQIVGSKLIIRTIEDTAVYELCKSLRCGVLLAERIA